MHTTKGCYLYRNGEVVHCTEDEIKLLWQAKRLGNELPDWDQTSEQAPVQMEHKIKLSLPPILDDSIRPLSRKENTYGQPIPQNYHRRRTFGPNEQLTGYMPQPPAENMMSLACENISPSHEIIPNEIDQNEFIRKLDENKKEFQALISDGGYTRNLRNAADDSKESDASSRQYLLFAEDICSPKTQQSQPEPPKPEQNTEDIPPCLEDADRALLDSIASPAVEHPRLPAIRLCEIAISLCKTARLNPIEISELLHKKLVPVRDKIMPAIKEHPDVHCIDGAYYIK
jgi:hypothetical protein